LLVCRSQKQQFHKEGAPEKQKSKIITAPSGQKYRDRAAERRDGGTIVTEDGAVIDEASLLGKRREERRRKRVDGKMKKVRKR